MSEWSDIGAELRSKREAAGQSLPDVSHHTRIPVATLPQLEENDYSQFPSAAYTKSFLAQYTEHLEIDATDWLDHFESTNAFADLDTIGYLQGSGESLRIGRPASAPKPLKPAAKKAAPAPAPIPAATQSPGAFQHFVVLTMTALFLAGGVYGFISISDRIEQAAVHATDADAGSSPDPVLAPAPSVVPSRPAPPKRPKTLNNPAPAVAEVVTEGSDEVVQPVLVIDAPPARAVIIEE